MAYRTIKGTHDILPDETRRWQQLENVVHSIAGNYGYNEIRTPVFEDTGLFSKSVGIDTDIVSKEMYSWEDRSGGNLTLRPELTAPVVRSFIQHNLGVQSPLQKLYYIGPLFRRERPQKGRQRQFHQFGVEVFGSEHPEQDAEIIALAHHIFEELGIKNVSLKLNSIGSGNCRKNYRNALMEFLTPYKDDLSETSQKRLETNPLRILDTKIPHEKEIIHNAPSIADSWTNEDKVHFESVQSLLSGLNIPYELDENLVRGLDYYTRTTFEFVSENLGAQDAICGGGRYDNLVEMLGGKPTPAIGFAAGIERILLSMAMNEQTDDHESIYLINLEETAAMKALQMAQELRSNGITVYMDTKRRSLKAQLREANKLGVKKAVILGEEELKNNQVQVKDLLKGVQEEVSMDELLTYFTV